MVIIILLLVVILFLGYALMDSASRADDSLLGEDQYKENKNEK